MVFAGMSGSRRDQPMEFKESRKDVEAMLACMICDDTFGSRLYRASLLPCSMKCTSKSLWIEVRENKEGYGLDRCMTLRLVEVERK